MTDNGARQQFSRAIEAEILRRMREESFYMDKSEIEEMGEREGIPREEAAQEFFWLAGRVWAGQIILSEGPTIGVFGPRAAPKSWLGVTFYPEWFRNREKLPAP